MSDVASMINTAMVKEGFWKRVLLDKEELENLGKTEEEAKHLATYYEGVREGLMNARNEGFSV